MDRLVDIARRFWGHLFAIAAVCGILSAVACGCSLFQGPGPNGPKIDPRSIARGAVLTLETVWLDAEEGCMTLAKYKQDDTIRAKCAKVLIPLRDGLLASAAAVDAWGAADQKAIPCLLRDSVSGFDDVVALLKDLGVDVPAALPQGIDLAAALIPQCTEDGGAPPAPPPAPASAPDASSTSGPQSSVDSAQGVIEAVTGGQP